MNFWQWLLRRLNPRGGAQTIHFELDEPTRLYLERLARQEQQPPGAVAARLLTDALVDRQQAEGNLRGWRSLSPREQEVAALTCLGYTNRQIGARLGISPETVKTHLHNLQAKLRLNSKEELRRALAGWDFSAWDQH